MGKEFVLATCGKFDVVHAGHCALLYYLVNYLKTWQPSCLYIGVVSDEAYKQLTGREPILKENERVSVLAQYLNIINPSPTRVEVGIEVYDGLSCVEFLRKVNPHVFVKGFKTNATVTLKQELKYCEENDIQYCEAPVSITGVSCTKIRERLQ